MATKHGRASEATAAPEDEETIYPSMDGHRLSVRWRLRDYEEKGALSSNQCALLVQRFELSPNLVEELSVLVGNSLDIDSAVNLVAVDRSTAITRAEDSLRRALRYARQLDDATPLRAALAPHEAHFARSEEDATVLKAAKASAGCLETPISDLMAAVEQVRNTPGCAADMSPADKRAIWDKRREHVVRSCCYVWSDAGPTLSDTTDPVQGTRTGRLVDFIQTVVAMVTDPPGTLSGETIRKDIDRFKAHLEDPDGILGEPISGPV